MQYLQSLLRMLCGQIWLPPVDAGTTCRCGREVERSGCAPLLAEHEAKRRKIVDYEDVNTVNLVILAPRRRAADLPVARESDRALRQAAALALRLLHVLYDDADGDAHDAHGRALEENVARDDLVHAVALARQEQRVVTRTQPIG